MQKVKKILRSIFRLTRQTNAAPLPVVPLTEGVVVFESGASRHYECENVALLFGTYRRKNSCKIHVRVVLNENIICERIISAESLVDNGFEWINIPVPYGASLCVFASETNSDNFVGIWWEKSTSTEIMVKQFGSQKIFTGAFVKREIEKNESYDYTRQRPSHAMWKDQFKVGYFDDMSVSALLASCLKPHEYELIKSSDDLAGRGINAVILPTNLTVRDFVKRADELVSFGLPILGINYTNDRAANAALHGSVDVWIEQEVETRNDLYELLQLAHLRFVQRWWPKISIISVIHNKLAEIEYVLRSYLAQDYRGEIELILVDDGFGDQGASLVHNRLSAAADPRFSWKIIKNKKNIGNCLSRNEGIKSSSGDIFFVIDFDCIVNASFISAHVYAHSYGDCEIVLGPMNIESSGRDPELILRQYEASPTLALQDSSLQEPRLLSSFLNCITRNVSFRSSIKDEVYFDPQFGYSLDPESGFGWEDVELGYRLYERGYRFKFTTSAISVHLSHPPAVPEDTKPQRSLKNLNRLFAKHTSFRDVATDWSNRTLFTIEAWAKSLSVNLSDFPVHSLNGGKYNRLDKTEKEGLRVLSYRWHVPHQYELYKLPYHFYLLNDLEPEFTRTWALNQRPLPRNVTFISRDEAKDLDFDLAIGHFDENVLSYENTNGKIGPEWGGAFRWFVENVSGPKIAVCHGTPQFYGQYTPGYNKPDLMQEISEAKELLKSFVGELQIVCNSHQAMSEWGFENAVTIWHGFDPQEFPPGSFTKEILSPRGALVQSRPHYRGLYLYNAVFSGASFKPEDLSVPEPHPDYTGNRYAVAKFRNYVDAIRQYKIYFNPTLRSPMPRARGEPMMCGVVTVNAHNHDVDMFIRNGINGFYSNDPDELRDAMRTLLAKEDLFHSISRASRETALREFHISRYLDDWKRVIKKTLTEHGRGIRVRS